MNEAVESVIGIPQTIADYAAEIAGVSGGQFTNRFSADGRAFFASLYGAPFIAIDRLAPELREKSSPSILIADSVGTIAADSGRWLSLYARARRPAGKLNCTVCVAARPRLSSPPKAILFQPPQQILTKPWTKHVRDLACPPDIIIAYAPGPFERTIEMVEELRSVGKDRKSLVACHSRLEALIVRSLLQAYSFQVSEVLSIESRPGECQEFSPGAWWVAANSATEDSLIQPQEATIKHLRSAYEGFRERISSVSSREEAVGVARFYATRSEDTIEEKSVRVIRLSASDGVDLDSGHFFSLRNGWDLKRVSDDSLASCPKEDQHDDRLELMMWLGTALHGEAVEALANDDTESTCELEKAPPPMVDPAIPGSETKPVVAAEPEALAPSEAPPTKTESQRPTRSRISRAAGTVNVLALAARLGTRALDSGSAFESARTRIVKWLGRKGFALPEAMSSGQFERQDGEVSVESNGDSIWSIRFDDRSSMEQGAIWRVEATLLAEPVPAIGLRLIQVRSSEDAPPPIASGVPNVVSTIARDVGLEDAGVALLGSAARFSGAENAIHVARLLLNPNRTQPVILFAGDVDASADRLASRVVGVAHVVCIDSAISSQLILAFGRERGVYGSAVRLYRPGYTKSSDPNEHPFWMLKGTQIPKWLANDIFEEACAISLEAGDLDDRVPSFQVVRNHLAEQRMASSERRLESLRRQAENIASSKDEQISQLQEIRIELEAALAEYKLKTGEHSVLTEQLRAELQATLAERNAALEDARQLRFQLENRWTDVEPQYVEAEGAVEYPDNWDDLETWVELYGENRLVLHPLAAKAARESPFKDIPLAYKAMEYLVRYYIPMRTRDASDTDAYLRSRQALGALGLEESDVGTAQDMKRYKKEYRRQYEGKEITLDRHLKRGVGFGGDHQFRLYFYYDEAAAKVVIGHMPTHLTNRLSHNG